jgi:glycosyltransferase involved in cell wall biosynthesis
MNIAYESYRGNLIHSPERQWEAEIETVVLRSFSTEIPQFSIVMPIHDQESIIQTVLSSIVLTTVGTYEIICILDGCRDKTKENVLDWLDNIHLPSACLRIHILETPSDIFETSCDNLGFNLSRGRYILEVQADMKILTFGYNMILATPMEVYPDILGVSGRCCHSLNGLTRGREFGKTSSKVEKPHEPSFDSNRVYLSHTANRGPLALRASMLKELGYLDEEHYVLGDDDHDLFTRAWVQRNWRSAFVPVEVYSPLEWGSTRKPMNSDVKAYLMKRKSKESQGFLAQNLSKVYYPESEIRTMAQSDQIKARIALLN